MEDVGREWRAGAKSEIGARRLLARLQTARGCSCKVAESKTLDQSIIDGSIR